MPLKFKQMMRLFSAAPAKAALAAPPLDAHYAAPVVVCWVGDMIGNLLCRKMCFRKSPKKNFIHPFLSV